MPIISMLHSADASMLEESCVCVSNPELHQQLSELQQLAGILWTENKQLVETVRDGKKIHHCTSYYEQTQKSAELEDLFQMLQTKKDDVIARILTLQKSCKSITCPDLLKRMSEFDNHVQRLYMENRNLLATQQEYYNYSTCMKLLQRLAEYENQTDTLETIKDNLLVAVHDLQETEEGLRHEAQHAETLNFELEKKSEHQLKEISRLRAELFTLKYQLDDAKEVIKDEVERTQELTRSTSLMENEKAEVKKLTNALQDRKEHEEDLNRQNGIVVAELARLESQRDKRYKENETLKTVERNLLGQLHEADLLILNKEELMTKQSREIDDYQKTIEEQTLLTEDLRKSACDLKDKLEEAQLELSRKQTEDCDSKVQEQLITVIHKEEVQPYLRFLKVFLFIVFVFVGFFIFGCVLTTGLAYNCHLDYHFLQPISNLYPTPL